MQELQTCTNRVSINWRITGVFTRSMLCVFAKDQDSKCRTNDQSWVYQDVNLVFYKLKNVY